MNKLVRYKGILTVLVPVEQNDDVTSYYTFPIDDYTIDIPEYIDSDNPFIENISIAKLHFSEARNVIKAFVNDYKLETNTINVVVPEKSGLLLHAVYDREY